LTPSSAPFPDPFVTADDPIGAIAWSWNVVTGAVTWADGIEEALFGMDRGAFGRTFEAYLALVHPDDRAYFQAVIARTLEGQDRYIMSHRVVWPDGSLHWVDGRGELSRDGEGRPLVLTGVVWTAGARRYAEARLTHLRRVQAVATAVSKELLRVQEESEAFDAACRIAIDHGHFRFAWIALFTPDETRLTPIAHAGFEDGYLEIIAASGDRVTSGPVAVGARACQAGVVNDIAADPSRMPLAAAALARGYRAAGAFPLRRRGKVVGIFIVYAAEANRFDADQIELLQGLADDIGFKLDAIDADAQRRVAEEAMRRSEERYRALVEQAADAVFLTDPKGTLLEVNAATCAMLGYERDALVGRDIGALLVEPDGSAFVGEGPLAGARRMRRQDGVLIHVELTAAVLEDGHILGSARDVTRRNELQEQLVISERLASLGRLAAGVAHEINNPLAYLSLSLERIARATTQANPSPTVLAEIAAAAADARDGADRVRGVTRSLGALSRNDEGAMRTIDVHHVLDGAIRLAANNLRHRGTVVTKYAAARGVRGNELRLGQVFINLLVNASDALREEAPDDNQIIVRTFDEGDHVIVTVRDNGVGMSPDVRSRIFEPFFTTKAVGEGTGLGLSISHSIVSGFGGEISVESELGRGTSFRVSLLAQEPRAHSLENGSATARRKKRLRILIVDDEVSLAKSLAAVLHHHEVVLAAGGGEALSLLRTAAFDCILCDLMMPTVSGMDVFAELERDGRGLERRMIFMTGGAFTPRARQFIAARENEVLEKPFGAARVEQAIEKLLGRGLTPVA
jgi:PAS domain S-box-containing protein